MHYLAIRWIPLFGLATLLSLFSCSAMSQPKEALPRATQKIVRKAEQKGFSLNRIATSSFLMTSYEKLPSTPADTIYVYIEGDGNSWKTRYKLSNNPTPKQPVALKLAITDPRSHVVYLARPCQYTPLALDPQCQSQYWSSHRYAQEVIDATNDVLDQIKTKMHNHHFVLIGFSGGASVATLICQRRDDIAGLITVAGDLDHGALNRYHHTSSLRGSLNPSRFAAKLKDLPQQHWSGSQDHVVPTWVAQAFVKEVNHPACAKAHILKGATHHKGWEAHWPEILQKPLTCEETHSS